MSREQFEEWIADTTNSDLHRSIMLDKRENGNYRHLATNNKWEAWQEATKHAEAKCAALAAKGMEVVREASLIYSKYNDTQTPDRDIVDQQTLQELYEICTADGDSAAFLAEVRAQGVEQLASLAGNECHRYKSVGDRAGARKWKSIVILCTDFSAQLRQEAAK
ncbi:hypothetical protein M8320_09115 [Leclercia sp. H6W5]|uniref:hypothetical protein n=1 Tax=Leclercia tamurae TaxID=2926467 RepID=UPI0021D01F8E|nr:hypothetical protein [Leclercia tamurae]MCU6682161.1 hypothetical protein [Leclercia tamurae]